MMRSISIHYIIWRLPNSKGGTKRMFIGKKYKHMADGKHTIDIIDGYGEFICDEASLNLYIVQK